MPLTYQFNPRSGMAVRIGTGVIDFDSVLAFYQELGQQKGSASLKAILSDFSEATFDIDVRELVKLAAAIDSRPDFYSGSLWASVVSPAQDISILQKYALISKAANIRYRSFATMDEAKAWLRMEAVDIDEIDFNEEGLG